jgi:hydrogenase expression/formation protein HypC
MCLAVPGQILSIQGEDLDRTGKVSFGGVVKEVNLSCVPEARVGDYVVVHVGFALSVVDEAEARQTFEYLRQIGATDEPEPPAPDTASGPPEPGAPHFDGGPRPRVSGP